MKKNRMTQERKRSLQAYIYLAPWLVGVLMFFIYAIIQTTVYSFQTVEKSTLSFSFVGISNFRYAFQGDAEFPQLLLSSLITMLSNVPTVLIFAFFVALLLKKRFKGDFMIKAIFFLTVILSSDVFLNMMSDTSSLTAAQENAVVADGGSFFSAMESFELGEYFTEFGIDPAFFEFISDAIEGLSEIMVKSGIPIFIFLAGLYSVPESMYEAANVEGATAWESFWKITLPLMGPVLLVNIVYTIVDSFSSYLNPTLDYIYDQGIQKFNIGYASALSWIYFIIIGIILGVVVFFVNRKIYYQGG
ncbi:MAG: sugar ABC transporter permease [Ruminococcaceae bacterium]|nr:sugar ABC transporter permease [Oscillospiraceae bacterium]